VRVEATPLFNNVVEGLVAIHNLTVLLRVLSTGVILSVFMWVLRVANSVILRERLGHLGGEEARQGVGRRTGRGSVVQVFEFRSPDELL